MKLRMDALITSLANRVAALCAVNATAQLIAIDGRSGVGKSTIARALHQRSGGTLVSGDDFFAGGVDLLAAKPEVRADLCIDRKRLGEVLAALKAGRTVQYHAFDWARFDGRLSSDLTRIEPKPILMLEGVYANHPNLRPLIDLSVLIKAPPGDRARRLLARKGALTAWERQWHEAEDWYFTTLATPDQFDLAVVNA